MKSQNPFRSGNLCVESILGKAGNASSLGSPLQLMNKNIRSVNDLASLVEGFVAQDQWAHASATSRYMVEVADGKHDAVLEHTAEDLEFQSNRELLQRLQKRRMLTRDLLFIVVVLLAIVSTWHPESNLALANLRCAIFRLDPNSFIARSQLFVNEGNVSKALEDCNTALHLNPTSKLIYGDKAELLFRKGDLEEAFRCNELSDRATSGYWSLKAAVEWRHGQYTEAAIDAHAAAAISNSTSDFLSERFYWACAGQHEKALRAAIKGTEVACSSMDRAGAYRAQARCFQKLGRWNDTLSACEKSLAFSEDSRTYAIQAEALIEKGTFTEAVESATKALLLDQYYAKALMARALALERLGRLKDAAVDRRMIRFCTSDATDSI